MNKTVTALTKKDETRLTKLLGIIHDGCKSANTAVIIARQRGEDAFKAAIAVGNALLEAKEIVGYGEFGKWLEKHVKGASESTLYNWMKLARIPTVGKVGTPKNLKKAYIQCGIIHEQDDVIDVEEVADPKSLPAPAAAPVAPKKCGLESNGRVCVLNYGHRMQHTDGTDLWGVPLAAQAAATEALHPKPDTSTTVSEAAAMTDEQDRRLFKTATDVLGIVAEHPKGQPESNIAPEAEGSDEPPRLSHTPFAEPRSVPCGALHELGYCCDKVAGHCGSHSHFGSGTHWPQPGALARYPEPAPVAAAGDTPSKFPEADLLLLQIQEDCRGGGHWAGKLQGSGADAAAQQQVAEAFLATDAGVAWLNERIANRTPVLKLTYIPTRDIVEEWFKGWLQTEDGHKFINETSVFRTEQLTPEAVTVWIGTEVGKQWLAGRIPPTTVTTPDQRRTAERDARAAKELEDGRCVRIPTGPPMTVKLLRDGVATLTALLPSDGDHKVFGEALSDAAAKEMKLAQSKARPQQAAFGAYTN